MFYIVCTDPVDVSYSYFKKHDDNTLMQFYTEEDAKNYIKNYNSTIDPENSYTSEELAMYVVNEMGYEEVVRRNEYLNSIW